MGRKRQIALIGVRSDGGAPTPGCRAAPAALRQAGLPAMLEVLGHPVEDHGDLVAPLPVDPHLAPAAAARCNRLLDIAGWTGAIHDRAYALASGGKLPIFLGGDHSISMGTISAVARACRRRSRRLQVLWLDAHADFNTPQTTPTGNLHGMPVAFLTGEPSLRPLIGDRPFVAVTPQDFHLFGLRSIDPEERQALERSGIAWTSMAQIDEAGIVAPIQALLDRVEAEDAHLHVSLDLDFLDPAAAPGVGCAVPGGADPDMAHRIMALLHASGRVGSVDLVELDPSQDTQGQSARLLAELAAGLFGRVPVSAEESVG